MANTAIRTASFKRRGFNLAELELWRKRSGVRQIFKVSYTETRCRVTYR